MHFQFQQLLSLSFIVLLSTYVGTLYLSLGSIFSVLLFVMLVEHLFIYVKEKSVSYISFSSLSTALGVMLMMVTPYVWVTMFVTFFALLQKQFLTVEKKHFFNPSNFALLLALTLFYKDAHIVLGQLGDTLWLKLVLIVVAMSILVRVNRWVIPLSFTLFYLLFQYYFVVSYDPVFIMEDVYHRFYSVSFTLFILFMLTDPKTTPQALHLQLVFALLIAFCATLLDRIYGFRVQHLFMVLFLLTPLVPLVTTYKESKNKKRLLIFTLSIFLLALSVIIFVQSQPPYYYEMEN